MVSTISRLCLAVMDNQLTVYVCTDVYWQMCVALLQGTDLAGSAFDGVLFGFGRLAWSVVVAQGSKTAWWVWSIIHDVHLGSLVEGFCSYSWHLLELHSPLLSSSCCIGISKACADAAAT